MSAQRGYILPLVLFGSVVLLSGIGLVFYFWNRPQQVALTPLPTPDMSQSAIEITDFDSCVKAGNAVMESYPRQCSGGGRSFTEVIEQTQEATSSAESASWGEYRYKDVLTFKYPEELVVEEQQGAIIVAYKDRTRRHGMTEYLFFDTSMGGIYGDYDSAIQKLTGDIGSTTTRKELLNGGIFLTRNVGKLIPDEGEKISSDVFWRYKNGMISASYIDELDKVTVYNQIIETVQILD